MKETQTALDIFIKQACKRKPLTREREAFLGRRILFAGPKTRKAAIDKLVLHNTRFAVNQATSFNGYGRQVDDLVQDALMGMYRAAERFDYRHDVKFICYAVLWIKQAMQRGVSQGARVVKLPEQTTGHMSRAINAESIIHQVGGLRASINEVAKVGRISPFLVQATRALQADTVSLDAPVLADDTGGTTRLEVIRGATPAPCSYAEASSTSGALETILGRLKEREQKVLRMVFGLGGGKIYNLREAGEVLGVSRERARQLRNSALQRVVITATSLELADLGGHLGISPESIPALKIKTMENFRTRFHKGNTCNRRRAEGGAVCQLTTAT